MLNFIRSLYFTNRFFIALGVVSGILALSFAFPPIFVLGKLALALVLVSWVVDILMLYGPGKALHSDRMLPDRFSNGDQNDVVLHIENNYNFPVGLRIIDELPMQFQARDFSIRDHIPNGETKVVTYQVRPVKRGEYTFGALNIFVRGQIGFIERRYTTGKDKMVKVYPSFLQMRQYELLAIHNNLSNLGIKKIQKIGHTMEFEQIKNYVVGDDYRTVNWQATARKAEIMVNQFQDERSQNIYSVIDKGRLMRMPFEGLSLLDYAINASLVLSNIAIGKHDRAGLITFADKVNPIVKPERGPAQMNRIMEALYGQKTFYLESNYEMLYAAVRTKINQRSLILLYTNFESLTSLQRNLKYLKPIAKNHVLVVVFFVNTELQELIEKQTGSLEDIYTKTVAEKFEFEKRRIVKELSLYNIHSILTPPKGLTVQVINKYLEIKARGVI